jgi:predicted NBD/HSP70 family sugar kinase
MADVTIRDPEGGGNQAGLRDQNARLVLSFIRRYGELPGAEIARRSGLSAQTVSNITRALEVDGLLTRGKAVKGKVGKPSVPVALNPGGAVSLGLNIGRRSAELVLVDFIGHHLDGRRMTYPFPVIGEVFSFLKASLAEILEARPDVSSNVTGIGIAVPNDIWSWLELVNAPADAMRAWKDLDLVEAVTTATGYDVFIENDATSACVAEHLLGRGSEFTDFAHIFVGAFVGGGLVLNNKIVPGASRRTASLGQMPVPDGRGGTTQLLNVASLHGLERALTDAGQSSRSLWQSDDWSDYDDFVEPWVEKTAANLAIACVSIASIVEVEAILIDGAMPDAVKSRLTASTCRHIRGLDLTGLVMPRVEEAAVGKRARSIGAALLPIHARYFLA